MDRKYFRFLRLLYKTLNTCVEVLSELEDLAYMNVYIKDFWLNAANCDKHFLWYSVNQEFLLAYKPKKLSNIVEFSFI